LFIEIPEGFEAQIRPGSGLIINKGITDLNSLGKIDADFRGEVCIILMNLSKEIFVIKNGERICHLVITKYGKADRIIIDNLVEKERGKGGFGLTSKE